MDSPACANGHARTGLHATTDGCGSGDGGSSSTALSLIAHLFLEHVIQVDERSAERLGSRLAIRRLAAAAHTDEDQDAEIFAGGRHCAPPGPLRAAAGIPVRAARGASGRLES